MPSRIDIGPEGGPFVAINENSNDLELQDINGNVIAVWDETAGQWDFKTNDLANVGGIDATGLTSSLDVGGNDLTNINAIDASEVSADDITSQAIHRVRSYFSTTNSIMEIPIPDCSRFTLSVTELQTAGGGPLGVQFSTDGGSTYLTSANYMFTYEQVEPDGTDSSNNDEDVEYLEIGGVTTNNPENKFESLDIKLSNPRSTHRPSCSWQGELGLFRSGRVYGAGQFTSGASVDHLRLFEFDTSPTALDEFSGFVTTVTETE